HLLADLNLRVVIPSTLVAGLAFIPQQARRHIGSNFRFQFFDVEREREFHWAVHTVTSLRGSLPIHSIERMAARFWMNSHSVARRGFSQTHVLMSFLWRQITSRRLYVGVSYCLRLRGAGTPRRYRWRGCMCR